MRVKAEPWVIHRLSNKGEEVTSRAHWPSDVRTNSIKRRPSAGAVLIGLTIGANSVHDASLTLATVSASRGPAVTDKCTDNPADATCPPMGPSDAKCASAAWRYTAACVGGPFDPNNIANCAPVFVGCPGYVPNTPPPTPTLIEPPSHDKGHEPPPPPHHHDPGSPPPGTDHPGPGEPPPGTDHPGPGQPPSSGADHPEAGTPDAPPHPQEAPPPPAAPPPAVAAPPVAPVGPPQAIEGPHAPDVPAPAIQAPVAPAPAIQAPVAPAPVAPAAPPPVMAPAPAPSPSK